MMRLQSRNRLVTARLIPPAAAMDYCVCAATSNVLLPAHLSDDRP
jgi:hypothetical protein